MSRYTMVHDDLELAVGWDQPLGTYFAQVFRADTPDDADDDDGLVAWCGYGQGEIRNLDALTEWCEQHGFVIADSLRQRLVDDRNEPWQPGPLQRRFGFTGEHG